MARRAPTLVYVHGAGAQPPEADWIRIHNQSSFPTGPRRGPTSPTTPT